MSWVDGIIKPMDMSLRKLRETVRTGKPGVLPPWGHREHDTTERPNNNKDRFSRRPQASALNRLRASPCSGLPPLLLSRPCSPFAALSFWLH